MNIKTKYSIGDKIYAVKSNGEIREIKIKYIYVKYGKNGKYINYSDMNPGFNSFLIPENSIEDKNVEAQCKHTTDIFFLFFDNKKTADEKSKQFKKEYKELEKRELKENYNETKKRLKKMKKMLGK